MVSGVMSVNCTFGVNRPALVLDVSHLETCSTTCVNVALHEHSRGIVINRKFAELVFVHVGNV